VAEFWPGGLTVILRAQPSLDWDLGETRGTVALRMPDSRIALELLQEVGPLAVSSANSTGDPAAMDADQAEAMLGDSVAVYLDGGPIEAHDGFAASTGSTIVDATGLSDGGKLLIVRHGVISDDEIARVVGADLVG
jgi:L-threonylcarbamoyladenylate synthase